jgi:hypothetical protein
MAAAALLPMCFGLFVFIFFIFLFWRICEKAGYSGAMSLLALIPGVGIIILLCILAFSQWPNQAQAMAFVPVQQQIQVYPGQPYPPQQPGYGQVYPQQQSGYYPPQQQSYPPQQQSYPPYQ